MGVYTNKNGVVTRVATNNILRNMNTEQYVTEGELVEGLATKQDILQYDVLPSASAENLGKIVQYIGTTTASYINGYFYKCISDGAAQPSYLWQRWNVQPSSGSASTFTNSVSCSVGATSVQLTNPLNSTSIVVEPFSQSVSGEPKAISSMNVTASTITLTFATLTEATDFICRVESIS